MPQKGQGLGWSFRDKCEVGTDGAMVVNNNVSGLWRSVIQNESSNSAATAGLVCKNDSSKTLSMYIGSSTYNGTGRLGADSGTIAHEAQGSLVIGSAYNNEVVGKNNPTDNGNIDDMESLWKITTDGNLKVVGDDLTGVLGELRCVMLGVTGGVTKATMQSGGWAICDGTTPASQGISSPTITTTPNLEHKFVRGSSNNQSSGSTGGAETDTTTMTAFSLFGIDTSPVSCVTLLDLSSALFTVATVPPFHELSYFLKVK